jgi:1,4-alpha-glucan branching enzyme
MSALQGAINQSGFHRVVYSETHDLVGGLNGSGAQRLPYRIAPASPTNYFARKRSMLAAGMVMTTPGIPMIFMGQEMLAVTQFADNAPLDWNRTNTYAPVVAYYRDLIRLRRNVDGASLGLTGPNISWHNLDNTSKLFSFHRWGAGPNDQVMAVFNCSNVTLTNYTITGFPANGAWFVNFNSDWKAYGSDFGNVGSSLVQVSGGNGTITIGPYSVLIMSRTALPNLDSDGDRLSNGWEQAYFGDPLSAVADADDDHDGATNLQEQAADTNPLSAVSVLRITKVQVGTSDVTVSWQGGLTARQVMQQATNAIGPWKSVFTNMPPTAISNSVTLPALAAPPVFFRVQAGP